MGGTSSKSKSSIDLSLATSVIVSNIMNCRSNSTVSQNVLIAGDGNVFDGVKQVQAFKLSTECSQDIENNEQLQQKVVDAVAQSAEASSPGILGMTFGTSSSVEQRLRKDISNFFEQKNITNIINSVNAEQGLSVTGNHNIVRNFTQQQTMDLLNKAVNDALSNLTAIQDINTKSAQEAKAVTTNPVSDIMDSLFSGLSKVWLVVGVFAIGFLLVLGIFFKEPIMAFMGMSEEEKNQLRAKVKSRS